MTYRHRRRTSLRSSLYGLARFLGDVNAISKGPAAMGRRVIRKAAYRSFGRFMNRLLK